MTTTLIIEGGIAILVAVLLYLPVWFKSRKVKLTKSGDEQPEWMRTLPPSETQAALKEDREGMAVYDYDPGEKVAAPFAEQIEDILRTILRADPHLKQFEVDLGSAADGGLQIWVNGKLFEDIESLPDERLQAAFREAIQKWENL